MSICPEGEYRNSLSEEEFWNYIYNRDSEEVPEFVPFPDIDSLYEIKAEPCSVCRSTTACGYDSEGRPMIHVVEDSESENELQQ